MEEHLAARAEDVEDQIALADGAAAGEDEHVLRQRAVDRGRQRLDRVRRRRQRDGDAAVRGEDRRQRELVDVVDLSRAERPAGFDDLVAG